MSLLLGLDTTVKRKENIFFLFGPHDSFIRMGIVLDIRAGHYIYYDGKYPCNKGHIVH